nr:hypothetical protein CFP56_31620 [Quercus suber]
MLCDFFAKEVNLIVESRRVVPISPCTLIGSYLPDFLFLCVAYIVVVSAVKQPFSGSSRFCTVTVCCHSSTTTTPTFQTLLPLPISVVFSSSPSKLPLPVPDSTQMATSPPFTRQAFWAHLPPPAECLALLLGCAEVTIFGLGGLANRTAFAQAYGLPLSSETSPPDERTSSNNNGDKRTHEALVAAIAARNLHNGVLLLVLGTLGQVGGIFRKKGELECAHEHETTHGPTYDEEVLFESTFNQDSKRSVARSATVPKETLLAETQCLQ